MNTPARRDGPSWYEDLRRSAPSVLDVAEALGLVVRMRRFGPCPACGKDDPRHQACTPRHGGAGWMCAHCKATGDVVSLAAWVLTGSARPPPDGWAAVRARLASHGWCSPDDRAHAAWTPPARPTRAPEPEPEYPDARAVLALLRACRPPAHVPAVAEWCRGRGLDVAGLPAGVLPDVYPWPPWWPWGARSWRLVVAACDARGVVRSLHARASPDPGDGAPKTRWPRGCRCTGLLFASPAARAWLRGAAPAPARLLVAEGITDYLAATQTARRAPGTLVLGAASGGFGALAEAPIPRATRVLVATDPDAAGDRYAAQVLAAIPRHDVRRVRLPTGGAVG